jgi:hypothetical protein
MDGSQKTTQENESVCLCYKISMDNISTDWENNSHPKLYQKTYKINLYDKMPTPPPQSVLKGKKTPETSVQLRTHHYTGMMNLSKKKLKPGRDRGRKHP